MLKIDVQTPNSSQYGVLHHFSQKLYEAFVRHGCECRLLSCSQSIQVLISDPPDFTIGFNGTIKMEDGSLLCDHLRVPHVSCLIDPPYRFMELTSSPYMMITCDDREGCALLKKRGFERTFWMPHAVEPELSPGNKKRIYDIVFLGTCIDHETRQKNWEIQFPPNVCVHMKEAAEACLKDVGPSFMSILAKNLDPANYQSAFEEVEIYIKGVDRLRLLTSFSNHKVHIFGYQSDKKGWKHILKQHPNLIVHPPVSYEEAIEIMQQSKVVLNSSLKNKQGAHERIFTAAACGALVVTNKVPFTEKHFQNGKEMLLFDGKGLPSLEKDIHALLQDENKRLEIAESGRNRVMSEHTWDQRVDKLLKDIRPVLKEIQARFST